MTDVDDFGPLESADPVSNDELSKLKQQVATLEDREATLKQELENEFGQKRAKFKDLYLQKEEELCTIKSKSAEYQETIQKLEKELEKVSGELEGVKTAAALSEVNKQEVIQSIQKQCQQEIASLQGLLNEAADEATTSMAARYDIERSKLVDLTGRYEEEIQELRSRLGHERTISTGSESFLTSISKSLKRVGGSLPMPASPGSISNTSLEHNENLEDSMKKAKEDAEVLKSVVLPLEKEIASLRDQLEQSQKKLAEMQNGDIINGEDRKSPSLPDLEDLSTGEDKVNQLVRYLKAEKAARKDLEMFVTVLTTQKNVLNEDTEKVRKELDEVCALLEEEKSNHDSLKQTWQMANDQFLESQRLMMMDMRRIEGVLSQEQQRQIAELQKLDSDREAQEKKVRELEEAREKQEKQQAEKRRKISEERNKLTDINLQKTKDGLDKSKSQSKASLDSTNSDEVDLIDSEVHPSLSTSELSLLSEDKFLDSGIHDTRSLSDLDTTTTVRISPDKVLNLPTLTEAQMKAITDLTPEVEARKSLLAVAKSKSDNLSLEGKRLVSEREWKLLQQEMKTSREKLGRPCHMCTNYEAQLQTVQTEFKEATSEAQKLDRHLKSEKTASENQQKYIAELEEAIKTKADEVFGLISSLQNKLSESEKYLVQTKQQSVQSQLQLQDQLKTLTESRQEVQKELNKLQEENESLMGKHSKTAQQLQNEDINLPDNMEEMQLLLLKYREEIIAAKVAKEHLEDTLRSEILFLKDQVVSEQQEKNNIEETLTQEIHGLQEKQACFESIQSELERESAVRAEFETKFRENELALKNLQAKNKQLISVLQQRVEEFDKAKVKFEEESQASRSKIQSLQIDLDNSEAVQRDFVKLSQSLQIQLEKIRQAENEVRWQHEDDVDECMNCKQVFSVTKRKHHCKHCGKIFCNDCITKTVASGRNLRASKVCDVCHTILVKDATPYFCTEPPASPD
ncbi:hypothetical protein LOTGIDRAFT_228394 [Lottia gigantea]|uniref:FYVE-type domain-containing protein n=1 Tax=Lottia gigantea TaxID=225164 RepID=V4C831_LOTGI|nr:hypothetical protein LOTGIDRAFT_228394 [Lottia gigantea]ESO97854.1 hypothetical protein LOTGIDRAFT_228394 [Lottia gigantea]